MNTRKRIGDWVVVGEFHRGERVVVLKVVHKDRPGKVVALKLCLDTGEKAVAAFKREIENTLEQPLPGDMPVVLDHEVDGDWGRPPGGCADRGTRASSCAQGGRLQD